MVESSWEAGIVPLSKACWRAAFQDVRKEEMDGALSAFGGEVEPAVDEEFWGVFGGLLAEGFEYGVVELGREVGRRRSVSFWGPWREGRAGGWLRGGFWLFQEADGR